MKAYVATSSGLKLSERERPTPKAGEVLIDVTTIALNRGECRRAVHGGFADGFVPGWDTVGTVKAIGLGTIAPTIGTRVVARGLSGGWAEARVVHADDMAELPPDLDAGKAASLATAGTTALGVLSRSGPLSGRRVLITAATGSVGRLAVQLATLKGAHVVAQARGAPDWLLKLGAKQVVEDLSQVDVPVDLVIESLGGPVLVQATSLLAKGGIIQSFGWSIGESATFAGLDALMKAGGILQGFAIGEMRVGSLLRQLIPLVQAGELDCGETIRKSWNTLPETAIEVLEPGFHRKAILGVS